jgi:hypothetical protein
MDRRDFLAASLLAPAMAPGLSAASAQGQGGGAGAKRVFYEWTRYELRMGPGGARLDRYLRDAYFPALKRQGLGPLGAFSVLFGPGSPTLYTLVTLPTLDALGAIREKLAADSVYTKAAAEYHALAPADAAYARKQSAILHAFAGMPNVEVPPAAAGNKPRIFEFRVYESPSERTNDKKVEMFDVGEIEIFRKTGLTPVFFGQAIAGSPLPSLFYLLTFDDIAEREKNWAAFRDHPEWKALSGKPEYANEAIMTKLDAILLRPTAYSEI